MLLDPLGHPVHCDKERLVLKKNMSSWLQTNSLVGLNQRTAQYENAENFGRLVKTIFGRLANQPAVKNAAPVNPPGK